MEWRTTQEICVTATHLNDWGCIHPTDPFSMAPFTRYIEGIAKERLTGGQKLHSTARQPHDSRIEPLMDDGRGGYRQFDNKKAA